MVMPLMSQVEVFDTNFAQRVSFHWLMCIHRKSFSYLYPDHHPQEISHPFSLCFSSVQLQTIERAHHYYPFSLGQGGILQKIREGIYFDRVRSCRSKSRKCSQSHSEATGTNGSSSTGCLASEGGGAVAQQQLGSVAAVKGGVAISQNLNIYLHIISKAPPRTIK